MTRKHHILFGALTFLSVALIMLLSLPAQAEPPERTTIVDIALAVNAESGEFSTLIAALVSADLVDALDGKGQFTVFAPTDAAFAAAGLDAGNIGDVPVDVLTGILLYHVAPGNRPAEDVLGSTQIRTLAKSFVGVEVNDDGAFLVDGNGDLAELLAPDLIDIFADNGVIHVIDAVLFPPSDA